MRRVTRTLTGAALALSMLAAACGDDSDNGSAGDTTAATAAATTTGGSSGATTAAASTAPKDVDTAGVLKLPFDLQANGGPSFDPAKPTPPSPQTSYAIMLYDTLLRPDKDGKLNPGLAKSATIVDPSTIKIELFPNIKFSDGTPLDAAAAKFGIERNRDGKSTTLSAELQEISEITVDSPTAFTMKLKTPIAGAVYDLLGHGDFLIVSPTAVKAGVDFTKAPVGAGPFKLSSVTPGQVVKYVKNPDYFQADKIRLAGVEWYHVTAGPTLINALRAGDIDVAEGITYTQANGLSGGNVVTELEAGDNVMLWGQMCKSRPPFDNLKVRQALNYGIDRTALNNTFYGGKGEPMWGFWGSKSPLHSKAVDDYYKYDPTKAKQLLAEAGASNLSFDMFFTPGVSDAAAEIVQRQWADIGVKVNIKPLTAGADFFPDAKAAPINFFPLERTGIQKVARVLVPGSVGNVCNWDDPDLNGLVAKIKSVAPDSKEAVQYWADLQKLVLDKAMNLFGIFGVRAKAYLNNRVGNPSFMVNFQGRPTVDYYNVYIKK
ncbi:MAG: ABC transporter substrate-binding protein [Acidimicrobiia bacterium]